MSSLLDIVLQCAHLDPTANRSTLWGGLFADDEVGVVGGDSVLLDLGRVFVPLIPTNCSNESIYKFEGKFSKKFSPWTCILVLHMGQSKIIWSKNKTVGHFIHLSGY